MLLEELYGDPQLRRCLDEHGILINETRGSFRDRWPESHPIADAALSDLLDLAVADIAN